MFSNKTEGEENASFPPPTISPVSCITPILVKMHSLLRWCSSVLEHMLRLCRFTCYCETGGRSINACMCSWTDTSRGSKPMGMALIIGCLARGRQDILSGIRACLEVLLGRENPVATTAIVIVISLFVIIIIIIITTTTTIKLGPKPRRIILNLESSTLNTPGLRSFASPRPR